MRKLWPAVALAVCIGLLSPTAALAARPKTWTHSLDYFHARQRQSGGFSESSQTSDANITPWVILAISATRENPSQWKLGGASPVSYLQGIDLEAAAASTGTQANAPSFYAKCILAYKASGRPDLVYSAGSKHIDLVAKLNSYRYSVDGHYSPSTSGSHAFAATNTTIWAILALKAAGETGTYMDEAVTWLRNQQSANGGWGSQSGAEEDVDDTAAAVQALIAGGVTPGAAVISDALTFLHNRQRSDAGFPSLAGDGHSYAESTAWAIQAITASGGDPGSAAWAKGSATPVSFLTARQLKSGAYEHRSGVLANSLMTTTQATIAITGRIFPFGMASDTVHSSYKPVFASFKPAGGARFTTHDVTVTARYHDNSGGTGIKASAVRVVVDGKNRTGPASVSSSGLTLKLTGLGNGSHSVTIKLVDRAGNTLSKTHEFTVSVPTPPHGGGGGGGGGGGSTPTPPVYPTAQPTSGGGGGGGGGGGPTIITPSSTPFATMTPTYDPYGTTTPYPYGSSPGVSGYPLGDTASPGALYPGGGSPSPAASTSGQLQPSGGGDRHIPMAGLLGGALVALIPIGAAGSFLMRKRLLTTLSGAGHGKVLPGGGSSWQRFRHRLGLGARHGAAPPADGAA